MIATGDQKARRRTPAEREFFARSDGAMRFFRIGRETYIFQPFREGTVPIEMAPRRGVGETRRVHAPRLD